MSGFSAWLSDIEGIGAQQALEAGLPTKRVESWRYVPTRSLTRTGWRPATPQTTERFALTGGRFSSIPEVGGLKVTDAKLTPDEQRRLKGMSEAHGFGLTQAALDHSLLILTVQGKASVRINLDHLANEANSAGFATLVLRLEAGSQLTFVEQFEATVVEKSNLSSLRCVITLSRDASVTHVRFQEANAAAHIFSNIDVSCGENAAYRLQTIEFGAKLARSDINIALAGREASASVNGLAITKGSQYHDTHLTIDHVVGDTKSEMTFRNMVDGKGEATINGRVLIRRDSQRSGTEQSIANLLLSESARVNPKPELEIYADDVTASHGCTVGSLNKTELFYLKSRGLSEADARAFLQYAFAEKIIGEIQHPDIRDLVETQLLGELQHGDLIGELKESVDV
jgi:Fe-S cluster assembly protein SufD